MPTKKQLSKNNKTLKKRITDYIYKKKDICCERDIERKQVIEQIVDLYKKITEFYFEKKEEYLSYINNDLLIFIGYKLDLESNNDKEGVDLWNSIDRSMIVNKKVDKKKTMDLLNDLPLFYLLSFLGMAYYKYRINKNIEDNAKK